jgi:hypothetical protein
MNADQTELHGGVHHPHGPAVEQIREFLAVGQRGEGAGAAAAEAAAPVDWPGAARPPAEVIEVAAAV